MHITIQGLLWMHLFGNISLLTSWNANVSVHGSTLHTLHLSMLCVLIHMCFSYYYHKIVFFCHGIKMANEHRRISAVLVLTTKFLVLWHPYLGHTQVFVIDFWLLGLWTGSCKTQSRVNSEQREGRGIGEEDFVEKQRSVWVVLGFVCFSTGWPLCEHWNPASWRQQRKQYIKVKHKLPHSMDEGGRSHPVKH